MYIFNRNRYIALCLMMITAVLAWYTIILLTNEFDSNILPVPNNKQIFGLFIGLFSTFIWWIQRCYEIKVITKKK